MGPLGALLLCFACRSTPIATPAPRPAVESASEPRPVASPAPGPSRDDSSTATARPEPAAPAPAPPWCAFVEDRPCPEVIEHRDEVLADMAKVHPYVVDAAREFDVPPSLIHGLLWVESKYNARARGPAGARGLMQLMPRTSRSIARKLGVPHRPYHPRFNIRAGSYYIGRLLRMFEGDAVLALAAYSRGPGRVRAWVESGTRFPDGTRRFIVKVLRAQGSFEHAVATGRLRLEASPERAAS